MLWRAAVAGGAAFFLSLVVELVALGLIGGEASLPLMAVSVAPVAEELAKRLGMLVLSAGWGATGLAFGLIEGAFKLSEWRGIGVAGAIASVLQHWAYGRWAARRGLLLALGLHVGFNALVLIVDFGTEARAGWFAPILAALLLATTFWRPSDRKPV
ncbi:MAG: hypothetical protein JWR10_1048 [Rubritepida sp.]|nr:hypothetical protein [Rubritepida sp.]